MTTPFHGPDRDAVELAADFWTRMEMSCDPDWRVFLGPPDQARGSDLILTDADAVPLAQSSRLVSALRRNSGAIGVGLADRSGQLHSTGTVATRRSIARSVAAAARVAGPLAVAAAHGHHTAGMQFTPASTAQVRSADLAATGWFSLRLARAALTYREWACATITIPDADSPLLHLAGPWLNGQDRFWADPFVLTEDGRTWLFMEELDRATGRGRIVAAEHADGQLRQVRAVLADAHHLSFPQVCRQNGRWLATVETCAAHNPVYEFDALGDPWRPCPDFPALPAHTADAVLDFATGDLVGTDATTDGFSVLVRYTLRDDRWVPVPSAVRVDVAWSRGGGTVDLARDVRVVQDCTGTYGVALGWTSASDPDRRLARWTARDLSSRTGRWRGIHSMTWDGEQESVWIDGWRRRISPLGWRHRLTEQSHFKVCQG